MSGDVETNPGPNINVPGILQILLDQDLLKV